MLRAEELKAREGSEERVRALYEEAFPPCERGPFETLRALAGGPVTLRALYDGDTFAGFYILLTSGDIAHILYFAIVPEKRGSGLGGEALRALVRERAGMRILADVEAPVPEAENDLERRRRIEFYRRNGFSETNVGYEWRGEVYRILCANGALEEADFWGFWERVCASEERLARF